MILLVVLFLLAAVAINATVATVRDDRPRTPPRSRFVDPDFLPPTCRP